MIIASACLLGVNCRWDGHNSKEQKLFSDLPDIIPVCPEQLGGLCTPRKPAQIIGGNGFDVLAGTASVINSEGVDKTSEFVAGAHEVLNMAILYKVSSVILKEQSPSCGVHFIHQGKMIVSGMGVTCALLTKEGFHVKSVEEMD
jgi:uncharacterized protein YbbK (DUF523 family)